MTLSKKPLHLYLTADMITSITVLEKQCISDKCKCNLMASLHLLQLTLNTHNGVMMPELELRKTYSTIKG